MDKEQDYSLSRKENKSWEIQEFCQTFTKGESKSQDKQSNTASTPRRYKRQFKNPRYMLRPQLLMSFVLPVAYKWSKTSWGQVSWYTWVQTKVCEWNLWEIEKEWVKVTCLGIFCIAKSHFFSWVLLQNSVTVVSYKAHRVIWVQRSEISFKIFWILGFLRWLCSYFIFFIFY